MQQKIPIENLYYLLQKGVDHNKTDKFNRSPIFYAFINQNEFLDYT